MAASTVGLLNFRAQSMGVSLISEGTDGSAPRASSKRMTSMLGRSVATAKTSGVNPRMSRAFTAAPASSSSLTVSTSPFPIARCNAVTFPKATGPFLALPERSGEITWTSALRARRKRVRSAFPLLAAPMSAVTAEPTVARALMSAPFSRSNFTTAASFTLAAATRGVSPLASCALTSAPFSRSSFTVSIDP